MSYEAWGDDDDGMDGFREHYRKQLIEDGWLDDGAAAALRAERDALAAKLATPPESGGQGEIVTDAEIAEWRSLRGEGMTSAVGEYTPREFWDALDEIERLRKAQGVGNGR